MLYNYIAKKTFVKWGDKLFEDDILKIVKKHALYASIVMFLPLLGVDSIIFAVILWHMYYSLSKKCNIPFELKSIIVGAIINVVLATIVDFALMLLPFVGNFGTGVFVYFQFYLSGKGYIETLRKLSQTNESADVSTSDDNSLQTIEIPDHSVKNQTNINQ